MLRFTFICLTPLCILILLFAASFEIGASLTLSDICIDPQKIALTLASSPQDSKQPFTISDNDNPPVVDFNATSSNDAESVSSKFITVDLSAASGQEVTVDYAVTGLSLINI